MVGDNGREVTGHGKIGQEEASTERDRRAQRSRRGLKKEDRSEGVAVAVRKAAPDVKAAGKLPKKRLKKQSSIKPKAVTLSIASGVPETADRLARLLAAV